MEREIIHKKVANGTLVRINSTGDIGIVVRSLFEGGSHVDHLYYYKVLVKGKKVKAYQGGFTVIGEL